MSRPKEYFAVDIIAEAFIHNVPGFQALGEEQFNKLRDAIVKGLDTWYKIGYNEGYGSHLDEAMGDVNEQE